MLILAPLTLVKIARRTFCNIALPVFILGLSAKGIFLRIFLPMAISQGSREVGTHPIGCLFTCKSMDLMRLRYLSSPGKCVSLPIFIET